MISFLNSLCSESSQTHNPSFFLNTDKIYKRYIKHYRNIQYELTVNINYNYIYICIILITFVNYKHLFTYLFEYKLLFYRN